jgi:hypothetical protein
MLDCNKPAQTQTLGIGAPGLRSRRNRRRQAAHPGWVRPLATGTDLPSRLGIAAPIEASVRLSAFCGSGHLSLAPVGERYAR